MKIFIPLGFIRLFYKCSLLFKTDLFIFSDNFLYCSLKSEYHFCFSYISLLEWLKKSNQIWWLLLYFPFPVFSFLIDCFVCSIFNKSVLTDIEKLSSNWSKNFLIKWIFYVITIHVFSCLFSLHHSIQILFHDIF